MTALYRAELTHERRVAPARRFRHRTYLWLVDLDDLPRLPWWLRPLARFDARDHLGDPRHGIRANLDAWLAEHGVELAGGRVLMLAQARVLGHVFNPISVFWCHRPDGSPACVVAEVHNTHHQRHRYLLHPDTTGRAVTAKTFPVSPFLSMDGDYVLWLPRPGERLALTVVLRQHGESPLVATLRGTRTPVTTATLVRSLVTLLTGGLIRRHGIALWLRRASRPGSAVR